MKEVKADDVSKMTIAEDSESFSMRLDPSSIKRLDRWSPTSSARWDSMATKITPIDYASVKELML